MAVVSALAAGLPPAPAMAATLPTGGTPVKLGPGALAATSMAGLDLGVGTVSGDLVANSNGGAITQSGALMVTGNSDINAGAGAGAITLTNTANIFGGPVNLQGGVTQIASAAPLALNYLDTDALTVTNTGALTFVGTGMVNGNLAATSSGGGITQLAGALTVAGSSSFNAGTGAITLNSIGNFFSGPVSLTGGTTQISSRGLLILDKLDTGALTVVSMGSLSVGGGSVNGTLDVSSGGSVMQYGGAFTVSGSTTINAGSGMIIFNKPGNRFQGGVTLVGTGIVLSSVGDLNIVALTNGTNGAVALIAGGALTLPATAIDTGTSNLQLAANGGTLMANGALSGRDVALSSRDGMVLSGPVTATGQLALASSAGTSILVTGDLQAATTQLGGGTLRIGNGSTTGSIRGNVVNNGALVFNRSDSLGYGEVISGTGSLAQQGGGTLTLSGVNTYTGATVVTSGTLALAGAGSIASSSGVQLEATGTLDISGLTAAQATLGNLTGAGQVRLGAKTLATGGDNGNGTFSGAISGTGSLLKTGSGTLTLGGNNSFSGGTALKQGRIDLASSGALGAGTLSMDDGTTLGFAADGLRIANAIRLTGSSDPVIDTGAFNATLAGAISGAGFLTKNGSGTLTLGGANNYTGATNVAAGTLRAGAANTFSAASVHSVASGATLDLAGFNQSMAGLTNGGVVSLSGGTPGATLTITGPYVGNNGTLRMGTALGDSASMSDRLILSGPSAVASGQTTLQITNLGGLGALTAGNGIEVISAINGASTTAQRGKDAFVLAGGHVDAGAYQYRLYAADANGAGENWYLRSSSSTILADPADPPVVAYRAETALYAALPSQLRQSNLAMVGNLHQRVGDEDPKAGAAGTAGTPVHRDRRAWGRVLTTDMDVSQSGTVSPASKGRLTGFQAGTDLLATQDWRAGLYVGQLDGNVTVKGFVGGVTGAGAGRNDLRNQYLGFYGTYAGDSGFYADAVLQLGRHRYTVTPASGAGVDGKGDSLLASLELGKPFPIGGTWSIEPQLQLIHQRIHLDSSQIPGAVVQPDADSSWLARVGARVKGEMEIGSTTLRPYGRVNLYKASNGGDIARFTNPAATTDIVASTGGTSIELAAGLTLALNRRIGLYGEVGRIWAAGGDTRVRNSILASAGLQVKW